MISEEARKIDGGFILVYGGIEENCTIKAVFDDEKRRTGRCSEETALFVNSDLQ